MRLQNAIVRAAPQDAAAARRLAGALAILLGVFVIYGVGFAQPAALHEAAHDGRHSFAFPCH
jgi:cobalt transporter subunit CbtB